MSGPRTDAPSPVTRPRPVNDSVRRLQIGIAGVLTVLLLVGLGGLIGDRARERAAGEAATTADVKMPGDEQKSTTTPLEELGVQPVSKDDNAQVAVKVPQAPQAAPIATVPDLEPDPALERARQTKR